MKVQQLKKILDSLAQDAEIVISRDPEGNHFHRVDAAEAGFVKVEGRELEILLPDETNPDDKVEPALILWLSEVV